MDILVTSDARYAPHLATMLWSLFANRAGAGMVTVHGCVDVPDGARAMLAAVCEAHGARWADVALPARAYTFGKTVIHRKESAGQYFRISASEMLPAALDRVLYLDADMIVRRPLDELWELPLGGAPLAASAWHAALKKPEFERRYNGRYFNSGVMLIDLAEWRRRDVPALCSAEYAADPDDVKFWDQCLLNRACPDWTPIHPRWNFGPQPPARWAPRIGLTPDAIEETRRDPAIYHFMGPEKPWQVADGEAAGFAAEYWRYRRAMEAALGTAPPTI